jgi:predicted Fe-S protein YdhL (DUF1289 family)
MHDQPVRRRATRGLRGVAEITNWYAASPAEKRAILARLVARGRLPETRR